MVDTFKEDGNKFKCKSCGEVFKGPKGKKNLVMHLTKKCKPNERVDCNDCHKDFSTKANLDRHRESMHNEANKSIFSCESCSFLTKYKRNLTRHVKRMHKN